MRLSDCIQFVKVLDYTANGTTDAVSDEIDTVGCEGVIAITMLNAAAADIGVKASDCATSGGSYNDVAGSMNLSGAAGAKVLVNEIYKPAKRYLKFTVQRTTTCVVGGMVIIKYGKRLKPVVSTVANVLKLVSLISPADGTA